MVHNHRCPNSIHFRWLINCCPTSQRISKFLIIRWFWLMLRSNRSMLIFFKLLRSTSQIEFFSLVFFVFLFFDFQLKFSHGFLINVSIHYGYGFCSWFILFFFLTSVCFLLLNLCVQKMLKFSISYTFCSSLIVFFILGNDLLLFMF